MSVDTLLCRSLLPACAALAVMMLAGCTGSDVPQRQPLGAECAGDDDQCESALCYGVDSATSVCTKTCVANTDCPSDMICDRVTSYGRVCLPLGLGGRCIEDDECPAGHRCDTDAQRCFIPVTREICSPCTSSLQCPEGGSCREVEATGERYCTVACGGDRECATGFVCDGESNQCVPANPTQTCSAGKTLCSPCRGDSECGTHRDMCVRNIVSNETFCGQACRTDVDCPGGFHCQDLSGEGKGPRQCVPNSATCAGYCDSDDPEVVRRQCGLGASCNVQTHQCEPATDGRLCSACDDDDGCPSPDSSNPSRCVVNNCPDCPYKGQKFCSTSCATNGQKDASKCPAGFFCTGLGSGGASGPWHCVPQSGTCQAGAGELGDDCTGRGAASCISGICIGFGAQSLCSAECAGDADCGDARFRCCAVTGSDGETFDCTRPPAEQGGVCSPRGGGFGADCAPGRPPCHEGVCLDLGSAQICTSECTGQTPCADGFSCREGRKPRGDGSFETVSVCFPDGGGETGSDCTFGPAACRSGLCLKKASGSVCTQTCDAGSCPDGYTCLEETPLGSTERGYFCVPDEIL